MKVFVTPPLNHLELSELGDNNFYILGQLYKRSEKYREYTKKAIENGRFTILDSGVGDEGEVLTNEELFKLTLEIKPNEVIPLDALYDKDQTLINFNQFLEWMKEAKIKGELDDTNILACPQGETFKDWMECYKFFLYSKHVATIGMSKKAIPHIMRDNEIASSRIHLVEILDKSNLLKKPLHFLGQGDPREFLSYPYTEEIVRSTDSCYPILSSLHNIDLVRQQSFERIPTPHDYFEKTITKEQIPLIEHNVDFLKFCCQR